MSNIKKLADHSKWTIMSSAIFVALQALQLVILTYLIQKSSFGYLSIANAFVFLAVGILESGVTLSIVQSDDFNENQIASLLKFNVILAMGSILGLIILSFLISTFYGSPEIQRIILWMLPMVLISAINAVFVSKMKRKLKFKELSIIEVFSFLLSFSAVLFFAYHGHEYMAIVYGYLIKVATMFFGLWITKHASFASNTRVGISEHIDFGKYIYGEKILTSIISNVDALIIGKMIGMDDLGVYDVFKRLVLRPIILFYNAIEQVAFSFFSRLQSDKSALNQLYKDYAGTINFICLPIIALIFINADLIIDFFPEGYGDYEWTLKLFCALITAIIVLNPLDLIMYSSGKSKNFLNWMLMYALPMIVALVIAAGYGLNVFIGVFAGFYATLFFLGYIVMIGPQTSLDFKSYVYPIINPILLLVMIVSIGLIIDYLAYETMILKIIFSVIILFYVLQKMYGVLKSKNQLI